MAGYGPHQPSGNFALNIERMVAAAKGDIDLVLRRTALDVFRRVIQKSPVGNPELWAANKGAMQAREAFTSARADAGKKTPTRRTLEKKFPLIEGVGYVGGRFKSNWQVSINTVPTGEIATNDKGATALAQVKSETSVFGAGMVITLVNNLEYANRLEFGHSNQAPNGMVRTTIAEFPAVVRAASSQGVGSGDQSRT